MLFLCALSLPGRAQDTLFVHIQGSDTLFTELHRGPAVVYRKNQPMQGPALRTNLFYWGSGTPNLGVEVPFAPHWSAGGNVGFKPWDRFFGNDASKTAPRRWRNLVVSPEVRWYPDTVGNGFFVGADLLYTHYNTGNVKFPLGLYKNTRDGYMQGNLFGGGLTLGYSWWLSRSLRLEVEAGAAAGWFSHDTYYVNERCQNCIVDHQKGPAVVPKLGLNLAYTFGKPRQEQIDTVVWHPMPVDTIPPEVLRPVLQYVEEWKGVAGQLQKDHPVLRPSSDYKPYSPDMILRKMDEPLYVHFRLDKAVIDPGFRNNREVLDQIIDITSQIMADTTSSVSRIQIVGLASIEGKLAHNQRLSDNRAIALQRYIQDRVPVEDALFESVGGGEAWTEFRDQVNDLRLAGGGAGLTTAQLDRVLSILDGEPDAARREQRLRALGGIYERLKDSLLTDQRNSGYIRIYYDYVPDENARQINAAITALSEGRSADALALLEPVKDDVRAANALAVALWQEGRQGDALTLLRSRAAAGDTSVLPNLEAMERIYRENQKYNL